MRQQIRSRPPIPYEQHRDYVLAVIGHRCNWLDPSDREAILHDAYAVLLQKQRDGQLDLDAMRPAQVRAYLTQTALNKAMDEGKRAFRRRLVSLDDESLGLDPAAPELDLDEQVALSLDRVRVREIIAGLPERQQAIVKLRHFLDQSPQEVQRLLGVSERVYRRELGAATRQIGEQLELDRRGGFCDSRRSLLLACATGIAGPSRRRAAHRHVSTCPGCASWLRGSTRAAPRNRLVPARS